MMRFGIEIEINPQLKNLAGWLSEIASRTIFLSFFGSMVVDRNGLTLLQKRAKRKQRQVNSRVR